MPRYEEQFELALTSERADRLAGNGGPADRNQLRVQLTGEALHASWPADGTFDHPPTFTGRLERRADGTLVSGTVREAWSNMAWARIWAIPTLAMAAVAVGGITALILGTKGAIGLVLLGAVGTLIMALMWRWQTSLRKPTFDSDTKKLTAGLSRYLTTGDGQRDVV